MIFRAVCMCYRFVPLGARILVISGMASVAWGQQAATIPAKPSEPTLSQVVPEAASDIKKDAGPSQKKDTSTSTPHRHDEALGKKLFDKMLHASAWVVAWPTGSESYRWGTAWLVDAKERLLVTNHHVVWRNEGELIVQEDAYFRVYFPSYEKGKLLTNRDERLQNGKWFHARLLDSDPARDLALLVVDELPADAAPLPLAAESAEPGERIHSLGNAGASGALWVYTSGTVRQVYHTRDTLSGLPLDYMRLESQSPTNSGDSGGPVVNDQGEIVAIHHASLNDARLVTHMVDVSELKAYLEQARPWLHPATAEDFNSRGLRYYEHDRYEAAIKDFSEAARLDSTMSDAINNRAWSFLDKGDHATALADFEAAIKSNASDPSYFQGRGRAYVAANDLDKAVADFTQAIRLDGSTAPYYFERGEAHYAQEKYSDALGDYQQAAKLEPTSAEYQNCLGVTSDVMGNYEAAVENYGRAIELAPTVGTYYLNRATTYRKMKDENNAIFELLRMERFDPEFSKTHRQKFDRRYLRITNDTKETLQVWVMYHTIDTNDQWKWFPAEPSEQRWAVYSFEPGESSSIDHEDFRVNADRVRIWAGNAPHGESWDKSTRMWTTYENEDLELVSPEGEEGYFMGEYDFHLK